VDGTVVRGFGVTLAESDVSHSRAARCAAARDRQEGDIDPTLEETEFRMLAIGDLYRFDRFTAPARLWDDLQQRYPELLTAG
jgi:hypothetical protein